jgi:hypothetical protein
MCIHSGTQAAHKNRTNSSVSSQPTMIVRSSYLTITDAVARIAFQPS